MIWFLIWWWYEESVVMPFLTHRRSVHVVVGLLCSFKCSNAYLRLYSPITWRGTLNSVCKERKAVRTNVGSQTSSQLISHNPPALACQSTDWLTSDIWSLNGILIGSLAACGLLIHRFSLKPTHTRTSSVCVCDSVIDPWRIFWLFFPPPFFFALLCTAWTIQVIVTVFQKKILRKSP